MRKFCHSTIRCPLSEPAKLDLGEGEVPMFYASAMSAERLGR